MRRDEKWRGLREAWSPFFFSGSLEQFAERMNYSVQLMCQRLEAVAVSKTGATIDMYPLLTDLTMVRRWASHATHSWLAHSCHLRAAAGQTCRLQSAPAVLGGRSPWTDPAARQAQQQDMAPAAPSPWQRPDS